ncbi:MAG: hypothetical protein MUF33_07125 [Candidatus Nanopelagicales bacterium]|nr:hypothetical protein [Candidatus Nanopelagicales bacterium]MCU0298277.1 hypothetical protein [Candidatus Nanopelagicales bacterium]
MSYCPVCGLPGHDCVQPLEPPRFCTECGRRMIVQVTPGGWQAKCSRHGVIEG